MLEITPSIRIPESELHFDFVRAAGPGGQNVNKVATAAQLRFDVRAAALPAELKSRLTTLAGRRMTREGVLVIEARAFRTQEQNRAAAIQRLVDLLREAAVRPKRRRKTKPSASAREQRLQKKKRRADVKKLRRERIVD
jgi:ribosome-associated protein